MPPTQKSSPTLLLQVEDAASRLSTLVGSASAAQLLQQPPPAVLAAEQQDILLSWMVACRSLIAVLPDIEQHDCACQVRREQQHVSEQGVKADALHVQPSIAVNVPASMMQDSMLQPLLASR